MLGPKGTTDATEPTVPTPPIIEHIRFQNAVDSVVARWPEDEPSQRYAALLLCQRLLGHRREEMLQDAEAILNWINGGDGEVDG